MNNRQGILKAIDWIEENLKDELTVLQLSEKTGYSLYHFIRLFQGVTGYTPKEYINRRKLTEVAKEIIISKSRISDIAFDYQFNDYETFCRAFKRMFGVTPMECKNRSIGDEVAFFERYKGDSRRTQGESFVSLPEIVERDSFMLVGLTKPVKNASMISSLWEEFSPEVTAIKERIKPERYYQLAYWPISREMDGFFIMSAVEVRSLREIPSVLVGKTVPPNRYLRFIHKGFPRKIAQTYQWIYRTYLPNSDYQPTSSYNFEFCGPGYKGIDDPDSETEIYIPIQP